MTWKIPGIGGGFVGIETATYLRDQAKKVVVIEALDDILLEWN